MHPLEVVMIAVGLALDALAVSVGAGASGAARGGRAAFRLSFHFGLFQFLMPVIGWSLGLTVVSFVASVDHWIAFALLAFVGGRMIRAGLGRGQDTTTAVSDPSRGLTLVMLCVATSIDALAVGLSLALLHVKIWYPAVVIGVITCGLSLAGVRMGNGLGKRLGKRMEVAGGVVLLVIGLRILYQHMVG